MAQKTKSGNNCTPTNVYPGYISPRAITGHYSPQNYAKELFKPFKDGKRLVVCNKKELFQCGM